MSTLRRHLHHLRHRRGFTLIELAIALALLASVLVALNRFALGGLQAASTNIEVADLRRQIAYTRQLIEADLAQSRACDPSGYGSPLLRLDPDTDVRRFAVYTTATPEGNAELVEWRFYPDGSVYRISTVSNLGANLCDAEIKLAIGTASNGARSIRLAIDQLAAELEIDLETQTLPYEIIAPARNVYAVELIGELSHLDSSGASVTIRQGSTTLCVGWNQANCYADRINLNFLLVTSGFDPISTRIQWSFPVNLQNARM